MPTQHFPSPCAVLSTSQAPSKSIPTTPVPGRFQARSRTADEHTESWGAEWLIQGPADATHQGQDLNLEPVVSTPTRYCLHQR